MKNNVVKTWKDIYKEWFNLKKDFSGIQVPEIYNPEKHFAVIVAQGLRIDEILDGARRGFWLCIYGGPLSGRIVIDEDDIPSDRTTQTGEYIILFNKNVEADKELKNLSADLLKTVGHKGITFIERLLLEILYFNITNEHLDINSLTICSGSRYSDGSVPVVHCDYDGVIYIDHRQSGFSNNKYRSRSVVS